MDVQFSGKYKFKLLATMLLKCEQYGNPNPATICEQVQKIDFKGLFYVSICKQSNTINTLVKYVTI